MKLRKSVEDNSLAGRFGTCRVSFQLAVEKIKEIADSSPRSKYKYTTHVFHRYIPVWLSELVSEPKIIIPDVLRGELRDQPKFISGREILKFFENHQNLGFNFSDPESAPDLRSLATILKMDLGNVSAENPLQRGKSAQESEVAGDTIVAVAAVSQAALAAKDPVAAMRIGAHKPLYRVETSSGIAPVAAPPPKYYSGITIPAPAKRKSDALVVEPFSAASSAAAVSTTASTIGNHSSFKPFQKASLVTEPLSTDREYYICNVYVELENLRVKKAEAKEVNHIEIALCLDLVGFSYICEGDIPKATGYLERARDMYNILGIRNDPDVALNSNNLGFCYQRQGDLMKGLQYFMRSLAINQGLASNSVGLIPGSVIAKNFSNIGRVNYLQRNAEQSFNYLKKAVDKFDVCNKERSLTREDFIFYAKTLCYLGDTCKALGDNEEAMWAYNNSHFIRLKLLGGRHKDTIEAKEAIEGMNIMLTSDTASSPVMADSWAARVALEREDASKTQFVAGLVRR